MQVCAGLKRYHSAPTSSHTYTQVDDFDFAQFSDDHLCSQDHARASHEIRPPLLHLQQYTPLSASHPQASCMANASCKSVLIQDVLGAARPRFSLSELLANESNKFFSPFDQLNAVMKMGEGSHNNLPKPDPSMLLVSNEAAKSYLARNNYSSPADNLSRLMIPEDEESRTRGRAYQQAVARFGGEMGRSDKAGLIQSSGSFHTRLNAPHLGVSHTSMEVLCKVSAKRGCATHPRSIAERVRRNKINEGIRKLQKVMPNMEKQTLNTVAMLDEAVEYVKSLQCELQELLESQRKCNGRCHLKGKA